MSNIKLIQRIRIASIELAQAYDDEDYDLADLLEDELAELENELESIEAYEYEERHDRGWN